MLGESAYVEFHAGRPAQALGVVRAAHQVSPVTRHPPELRAWLEAARAEHLAATGRVDDCLRALDRARGHLSGASASGQIDSLAYLDDGHMERWAGSCLARCGRPEAIEVLRAALARADPSFVRARAGLLLDLATATASAGDRDEVIHLAEEASQLAVQTAARLQVDRELRLLDQLTTTSTASPV